MNYKLLKSILSPEIEIAQGEVKTAEEWQRLFCRTEKQPSAEQWCNERKDWFQPQQTTLEDIIEEEFKSPDNNFETIWIDQAAKSRAKSVAEKYLSIKKETALKEIKEQKRKFVEENDPIGTKFSNEAYWYMTVIFDRAISIIQEA